MKRRKVPGVDNITVEEPEAATIGSGAKVLLILLREIQEQEVIPTEPTHSVIISIQKTDKLDCSNSGPLVCY